MYKIAIYIYMCVWQQVATMPFSGKHHQVRQVSVTMVGAKNLGVRCGVALRRTNCCGSLEFSRTNTYCSCVFSNMAPI